MLTWARVAGSHSTSGTLTFLFWHIFHNPSTCDMIVEEISANLTPLDSKDIAYSIKGLEASLPFTMACVRENFRLNPVFTMPLWRRVGSPGGASIGNFHVPYGVCSPYLYLTDSIPEFITNNHWKQTSVCISNYALHHNPDIWGQDHAVFRPDRWLNKDEPNRSHFLIPFSIGHRMCIGRNLAMTNILKTLTTLITQFEFQPLSISGDGKVRVRSSGIGEMEGLFECRVSMRE